MDFTIIELELKNVHENYTKRDALVLKNAILNEKKIAVDKSNQDFAKQLWIYETILKIQEDFIRSFKLMKEELFYEAWCSLEQTELGIGFLARHYDISNDEYKICTIDRLTTGFQSIFPYKIFMSPELLEIEKICSVCKSPISIRKPCEHIVGDIYDGKMCCRIVTKSKLLGMAMVFDPVQKYSVGFTVDKDGEKIDQYNYSVPKYLIDRLETPFDEWSADKTKKRHPHSNFKYLGRNDLCPCGSKIKYKKCCLNEEGVLRPHVEFYFPNGIAPVLQYIEYAYLKK